MNKKELILNNVTAQSIEIQCPSICFSYKSSQRISIKFNIAGLHWTFHIQLNLVHVSPILTLIYLKFKSMLLTFVHTHKMYII